MRGLWAAIRFLSIIPLPGRLGQSPAEMAVSVPWFPVVGLLIGLGSAGWAYLAFRFLPRAVASVLMVIALAAISKGLHLDGRSDTADAVLSSRSRARMLEIMKDSHVGVMGVLALFLVLSLKVAALASLGPERAWAAGFLMPLAGRCTMVMLMGFVTYARPEGGLGALLPMGKMPWVAVWAFAVLAGGAAVVAGASGLAAAGATVALAVSLGWFMRRTLGGATGDTLGASCELAEVLPALVLVAWPVR